MAEFYLIDLYNFVHQRHNSEREAKTSPACGACFIENDEF